MIHGIGKSTKLKKNHQLKVIYPQTLADRISQMAIDTLKMYGIEVG